MKPVEANLHPNWRAMSDERLRDTIEMNEQLLSLIQQSKHPYREKMIARRQECLKLLQGEEDRRVKEQLQEMNR